mgnify:CR=1 FL=1
MENMEYPITRGALVSLFFYTKKMARASYAYWPSPVKI